MAVDIYATLHHPPTPENIVKTDTVTFEVKSFSWGVDNLTTIGSTTAGAGAGKAKFSAATFTKQADTMASPVLFQLLVTGDTWKPSRLNSEKRGVHNQAPLLQ